MDIKRSILTLKVIGFMFLSSLFIASMSSVPAEATSECKCNYFSTFKYFKETFRTFHVDVEMCYFKESGEIEIEGEGETSKSWCAFELEANRYGCEADLVCEYGNNISGLQGIETDWDFSEEPTEACKRELQWIIWLYRIPECR